MPNLDAGEAPLSALPSHSRVVTCLHPSRMSARGQPLLSGLRLYCAGLAHCGGDLGPKRPVTPHRSGGPCGSGTPAGAGGRAGQAATGYSFVPVRSKSPSSLNGVMRTSVLVALMKLAVLPIESVPANVATMASASPPS